jgi:thioredoxin-like negative regulator of GroEL
MDQKPMLLVFSSSKDGRARRAEGFLAQVLQRRKNHDSFTIRRIDTEERPDLVERFRIDAAPSLLVVEDKRVRGRLVRPSGCEDIRAFLEPWLR